MTSAARLRAGLAAVLLSTLVAGCVTAPDTTASHTATALESSGPGTPTTDTAPLTVQPATTRAAAKPPRRRISLSPAERDPNRLRPLDPEAVTALIGTPGYVRHEGGAIVWQYMTNGCVMDLFWYRSDHGLTLLHYETRGPRLQKRIEASTCFTRLLIRQTAAIES